MNTTIEIQEWKGNKMLCLNAGAKYEFKFGASKARVITDNKMNISDFYDICMQGLKIKDKSIDENLRLKLKMKSASGGGEYMVLDLTPENAPEPFEITKYRASLILDHFSSIVDFTEGDDLRKGQYANQKTQEDMDERNKRRNTFK